MQSFKDSSLSALPPLLSLVVERLLQRVRKRPLLAGTTSLRPYQGADVRGRTGTNDCFLRSPLARVYPKQPSDKNSPELTLMYCPLACTPNHAA